MAKYELGAIYKINGRNGELYYVRLLTNECYGVFSSLEGELNEETFAQTHYRLYFSCNSFPIKRGIWGKVVSSPDSTDIARWQRPQYLWRGRSSRGFCADRPSGRGGSEGSPV